MRPCILALACAACFACGKDDAPKHDYSKCDVPAKIVMDDADLLTPCTMPGPEEGSEPVPCDPPVPPVLALPKGMEVAIPLRVEDAEGDLCDPSGLEIETGDPSLIEAIGLGEETILRAARDYLDDGSEPSTPLRLSVSGLAAEWTAVGVINLEGTWAVTVFHDEMYPDGLLIGEFVFTQRGRHLKWYDCTVDQACDEAGTVRDGTLSLKTMDANFTLTGEIAPDRNALSGTWSTNHYMGTWSADRVPE